MNGQMFLDDRYIAVKVLASRGYLSVEAKQEFKQKWPKIRNHNLGEDNILTLQNKTQS